MLLGVTNPGIALACRRVLARARGYVASCARLEESAPHLPIHGGRSSSVAIRAHQRSNQWQSPEHRERAISGNHPSIASVQSVAITRACNQWQSPEHRERARLRAPMVAQLSLERIVERKVHRREGDDAHE